MQIDHMTYSCGGQTLKEFRAVCPVSKFMVTRVYSRATAGNAKRFLMDLLGALPFPLVSVQVDGGSEFMAGFEDACEELRVPLHLLPPRRPQWKGKIERWFRTLREGWLNHLDPDALGDLESLNRRLWAWVEGEYHQAPHRGPDGEAPLDRWAAAGTDVRYPDPGLDFDDGFLLEVKRRVMKDRTVSLHGRLYEADAVLVGRTVVLRYDPEAPPNRPVRILLDGKPAG